MIICLNMYALKRIHKYSRIYDSVLFIYNIAIVANIVAIISANIKDIFF